MEEGGSTTRAGVVCCTGGAVELGVEAEVEVVGGRAVVVDATVVEIKARLTTEKECGT
jgi:hypothetical protein